MAKRFTDTGKWMDPWFHSLRPVEKLFWVYLVDSCDHAGIWKVNWPIAATFVGEQLDEFEIMNKFASRINIIKPDVWFIPSFIHFQYPRGLNPETNMAHRGVVKVLNKYNLNISPFKAPSKGLERGTGIGIGIGKGIGKKGGYGGKTDNSEREKIKKWYENEKKRVRDKGRDADQVKGDAPKNEAASVIKALAGRMGANTKD